MKTVVKLNINVPAEEVWEVVKDLTSADNYLPAINSSNVSYNNGETVRTVYLMDGTYYEETILNVDDEKMEMRYVMNDPNPFTYNNLRGLIKIIPVNEDSCEFKWICCYEAPDEQTSDVDYLLTLILTSAIKRLEKYCQNSGSLV